MGTLALANFCSELRVLSSKLAFFRFRRRRRRLVAVVVDVAFWVGRREPLSLCGGLDVLRP